MSRIIIPNLIIFLFLALLLYFNYKSKIEKIYYAKKRNRIFKNKKSSIRPETFFDLQPWFKIKNAVQIKDGIFWAEINCSALGGGYGRTGQKFDVVIIEAEVFNNYKFINSDLVNLMPNKEIKSDSLIPKNIADFLRIYGLSLESGENGAVLVKNNGTFKSNEVEKIINDFMSLDYIRPK